jgi:hypothetical protein
MSGKYEDPIEFSRAIETGSSIYAKALIELVPKVLY